MNKYQPDTPSFVFGYWKPWKENSNIVDSYLEYAKDVSLAKYGSDTVGKYIQQASKERVQSINQLGLAIGKGFNVLSNQMADIGKGIKVLSRQMADINDSLGFLNRNMDIQIEQQRISNLLLVNIFEVLRIPNSEKERQQCIELGIKFFVNAKNDADLYTDALEELLKAESYRKQDYFVLHTIGCIFLYAEKFINPILALDYFLRAAKYASADSAADIQLLNNYLLDNSSKSSYAENNTASGIGSIASDSFNKAAFCAYILGQFENAVIYQTKAIKLNDNAVNRFYLSKYQIRIGDINNAIENLDKVISEIPHFVLGIFKDIDLINEPRVISLIEKKNNEINEKLNSLINIWKEVPSTNKDRIINELKELCNKSYEIKVGEYEHYKDVALTLKKNVTITISNIDNLILEIKNSAFETFDSVEVDNMILKLNYAKEYPLEKMQNVLNDIRNKIKDNRLKIGSEYAGGIIFYLEENGKHGLVCSNKDLGESRWGEYGLVFSNEIRELLRILITNQFHPQLGYDIYSNEFPEILKAIDEDKFLNAKISFGYLMVEQKKLSFPQNTSLFKVSNGLKETQKIAKMAGYKKSFWGKISIPTAARLCLEYNNNGFKDWYLPTISELEKMYKVFNRKGYANFNLTGYWSCEDLSAMDAKYWDFLEGKRKTSDKYAKHGVRAVRAF